VVRDLVAEVEYKREIERLYKTPSDIEAHWNTVQELVNAVAIYQDRADEPSLQGYLEESALSGREDQRDDKDKQTEHAVSLMTLHSAKGLEFPRVYMVGMEEGLLPHQRSLLEGGKAIAEERRLAYVGVTRARDLLTLSLAKQRMKWGKPRPTIVSRFLLEMRGETDKALKAAAAAEEKLVVAVKAEAEAAQAKRPGKKTAKRATAAKPARAATKRSPSAATNRTAAKTASVRRPARPG
jgi:DNA helicase-2/ATP-dependent DNA helicase PcrA